jgi:hypothetical protein
MVTHLCRRLPKSQAYGPLVPVTGRGHEEASPVMFDTGHEEGQRLPHVAEAAQWLGLRKLACGGKRGEDQLVGLLYLSMGLSGKQ